MEQTKKQRTRAEQVNNVVDFERKENSISQRDWCKKNNIDRGNLQYWIKRKTDINAHSDLIHFFESNVGLAFLLRLIVSIHFSFTKVGTASTRDVVRFLELSELSTFVASSVGAQHKISKSIDQEIVEHAKSEHVRLGSSMPSKKVMLAEDETFHPGTCLVAMDLDSNYIFVEKYVKKRDAATWEKAVNEGLEGLPVEIVKVTGDQGKAIVNHAEKRLGVHHSPDLFHVSYEIGKGTSGALSSKVKKAEKKFQSSSQKTQKEVAKQEEYQSLETKPVGRPRDFEKSVMEAKKLESKCADNLKKAKENQETVKASRLEIGKVYHPYNTETGVEQNAEMVETLLDQCFNEINDVIEPLSERSKKYVKKAYNVVKLMKATIAFYFTTISMIVNNMDVSIDIKRAMHDFLIPGFYLIEVARKEKNTELKKKINKKAQELLSDATDQCGIFANCCEEELKSILKTSKECALFFQRSSSAVEGRNAQLSVHHHSMHRLSDQKLQMLTAIHNFYIKRADGTTAAGRFFETEPRNMFKHLLNNVDFPSRPRRKRIKLAA